MFVRNSVIWLFLLALARNIHLQGQSHSDLPIPAESLPKLDNASFMYDTVNSSKGKDFKVVGTNLAPNFGSPLETYYPIYRDHAVLGGPCELSDFAYEPTSDILEVGAYGTTHYILHRPTNKLIILKHYDSSKFSVDYIQKISVEERVLHQVSHLAILGHYCSMTNVRDVFFALEAFDGVPLGQHLASRTLEADVIANIVAQLILALRCLHTQAIAHGNVQPNSILINQQGDVKLTNFGSVTVDNGKPNNPDLRAVDYKDLAQTVLSMQLGTLAETFTTLPTIAEDMVDELIIALGIGNVWKNVYENFEEFTRLPIFIQHNVDWDQGGICGRLADD